MKTLTLLGSPRAKGNTATVLDSIEAELATHGHSVKRINIAHQKIGGCLGCNKCRQTADQIACVQRDDATAIFHEMIEADLILIATPVYYWGMTAQLKALVDRTNALITKYGEPGQTSLLRGKPLAILATGGGVYENNALLFEEFDKIIKAWLARKVGELHIGECLEPEDMTAGTRNRGIEFARGLLRRMETLQQ